MEEVSEMKKKTLSALIGLVLLMAAAQPGVASCPDCTGHTNNLLTACTTWELDNCGNLCRVVTFYFVNCKTGEILWEDETQHTCFGWCPI